MRALVGFAVIAVAATLTPAAAREEIPAETREIPWRGAVPACDDPAVLAKIARRFASRETEYWHSNLTIDGFIKIRAVAWRPWGADYIPRQFCAAIALVSDGKKRPIYYSVREGLGPIGATWGIEWCVTGLDRNYAYAPGCKMALP